MLRNFWLFKAAKKQSQSFDFAQDKFIIVLRSADSVMVLSFLCKQESGVVNSFGFRIECGLTCLTACFTKGYLKKQSQFCSDIN